MDPDGYIGFAKVFEAASVVEMEMTDDDLFDVFDVVAGLGDGWFEFVLRFVAGSRKDVVQRGAPDLYTEEKQQRKDSFKKQYQ